MDSQWHLFLITLILLIVATCIHGFTRPIKIGAIFHKDDIDHISIFEKAVFDTRYESLTPVFELIPVIKIIDIKTDSFKTSVAVCELLDEGVAAIFGPANRHTRSIVASFAAQFNVPHIEYVWQESDKLTEIEKSPMSINIFPASEKVSEFIAEVVDSMGWRSFAAIYENYDGLSRLQKALTLKGTRDNPITHTVRQLEGSDYHTMLKEIWSLAIFNVVIDVEPQNIVKVLSQAKNVSLLSDYSNFIITYLDSSKLPITDLKYGIANITGLSIRENNNMDEIKWLDLAILYDAVFLLYKALEVLNTRNIDYEEFMLIDPTPLSCEDNKKYKAGSNITSIIREIKKIKYQGKITGIMGFDDYGRREDFDKKIVYFRQEISIYNWTKLQQQNSVSRDEQSFIEKTLKEREFIVSIRQGAPYIMKMDPEKHSDLFFVEINKEKYVGYCIDLFKEIQNYLEIKSIKYELVPDNMHGGYDPKTKSWNGLIKRILDHKADFAICDLTITSGRKKAVDFSLPFMNLGISILYNKPQQKDPDYFSFLYPFNNEVWIFMATAYLIVSLMLFLQARIAPEEWDNPHPCNSDPEELENNFNLKNATWLTIGSLMQQGSDILPKAPSIRMLTSMWWFFTLIMISSYTANLAAFLTIDKMDAPIKGVEDLAKQTKIKYGALKGGSTADFFKKSNYSTYKRMWTAMMEWRNVFTNGNDEGVRRVIAGKRQYAFLMESTTIEYEMQRNCDLDKIGGLIDSKGYGIALPRDSPYRTYINKAILNFQESGKLDELKKKWWEEVDSKGKCKKDETTIVSSNELDLENVGGVFLVLACGICGSFLVAICEFLWNVQKVAIKEKITPSEAFVAELKFAVNIFALTKPVKIRNSSSASSLENRLGRAASTARSIVGSFLRLDKFDKLDKDHNDHNNKIN